MAPVSSDRIGWSRKTPSLTHRIGELKVTFIALGSLAASFFPRRVTAVGRTEMHIFEQRALKSCCHSSLATA
jgi:hypothetical protein